MLQWRVLTGMVLSGGKYRTVLTSIVHIKQLPTELDWIILLAPELHFRISDCWIMMIMMINMWNASFFRPAGLLAYCFCSVIVIYSILPQFCFTFPPLILRTESSFIRRRPTMRTTREGTCRAPSNIAVSKSRCSSLSWQSSQDLLFQLCRHQFSPEMASGSQGKALSGFPTPQPRMGRRDQGEPSWTGWSPSSRTRPRGRVWCWLRPDQDWRKASDLMWGNLIN